MLLSKFVFDYLTDKLQETVQRIRGQKTITEANVEEAIAQVRRSLLESDVSLKAVKLFVTRVQDKALGAEVLTGVKPGEQIIKIFNDALVEILGGDLEEADRVVNDEPGAIMLLGLQGAGKTTAAAKLATKLKKENKKPLLVPCDLQRPAAIKQLKVLAEQAEVDFLDYEVGEQSTIKSLMDLVELAKDYSSKNEIHTVIYDTAGRLQIDTDLMAELLLLEKATQPKEKLLVIDSLIGQEAVNVAETFNTQIGISGVLLTKLDGDSKGGAALSVVEATQKPIKLASVGEKLGDLEQFYPERMAGRILGMGDVVSLVEKAQQEIDEKEAARLEEQLMKGTFNYETFMAAQKMMSKLGDMGSIFKMMGMGSMFGQMGIGAADQEAMLEQGETRTNKFKAAINSMTVEERRNPAIMSNSRKSRIAKGSGLSDTDVNQLVSEFSKMQKVFGQLGPLLNMMPKEGDTEAAPNPMDMMGLMGGAMQNSMSKKQQKAMKKMGMAMPGAPQIGSAAPKKKLKKGQKPQIKGFRD